MKKLCWLLILVLLLSCFAGCQATPAASRSIENADGTLSDWMKEEIDKAYYQKLVEEYGHENVSGEVIFKWWNPQKPNIDGVMYYGTFDGYIMYCVDLGMDALGRKEIAGYEFLYPSIHELYAYKDGKFYELQELVDQGLLGKEAIAVAHNRYTEITEIINRYKHPELYDDEME